jgi:hypothetical protein
LTVDAVVARAAADGPERAGVFRLNVTPQKAGTGRIVIRTRRTAGDNIEVIAGLNDGERIVVRGADKMPRQ